MFPYPNKDEEMFPMICALCGEKAKGFAILNGQRYCHAMKPLFGGGGEKTCYTKTLEYLSNLATTLKEIEEK